MRHKLLAAGYFLTIIFFCLNCHSPSDVAMPHTSEESELLPATFEKLNYQVKIIAENVPNDWLKENFQTQRIKTFQVKNRISLKQQSDIYPRYTVVEEVYETPQSAAKRLERIQEKPPDLPVEQQHYWMVTGFQRGKNVYFIQTDAAAFLNDIENFADQIRAELSRLSLKNDQY